MSAPRLEARSIRVERGGRTILEVKSLALDGGETLAVVGPNGSGKTTLLLVLAQVERPSAGDVLWDGSPVRTARQKLAARRRTAAVLQQPLLFDRTVFENVAAGLRFRSLPKTSIRERTTAALESLGIGALARRAARTLSGGEAQRVSLARAFALHPEVLLLDEPFSALDPPTRRDLLRDLERNLRASGAATVLTTHDLDDALALADRILVLNKGCIAQCDTPPNILDRPADAFVARLVGMDNLLEAKVLGSDATGVIADWAGVRLRLASTTTLTGAVLLGVRPERVRLQPPSGAALTQATVSSVTPTASGARVVLDCGIVALELDAGRWSVGERVGVEIPPDALHVLPAE